MYPTKQKITLDFTENHSIAELLGDRDKLIKLVERKYNVDIFVLGNDVEISGKSRNVKKVIKLLNDLSLQINIGQKIDTQKVSDSIKIMGNKSKFNPHEIFNNCLILNSGKKIKPRTEGQDNYIEAIRKNTIVFSIGPAGTGKTYLAMAMAISSLVKKEVNRVVLARPAVEAGEHLGFLPGDLYEKVNPYLRPLYDALYDMMDFEHGSRLLQQGIIEVAPLAFMRGRTLNDSFVILDEAQNATPEQMKMFLTRLGFSSKCVVTGDVTQTDLPDGKKSGLIEAKDILQGVNGIQFVYFSREDVIRHPLVQEIIEAYEKLEIRKRFDNGQTL